MSLKRELETENVGLFQTCISSLENEMKELEDHYNIARNLACTEWDVERITNNLAPCKILPEQINLLQQNYEQLRTRISLRRYLLIKAFKSLIPSYFITYETCGFDVVENVKYWDQELKKKNPDIGKTSTRFKR